MNMFSIRRVLALTVVGLAAAVHAAEPVYIPMPVVDKIATFNSTELDIGEAKDAFDLDRETLIRTPAINPAFAEVEFTEPITFEALKVLIWAKSTYQIAAADNLDDLHSKSGSYRVLVADGENNRDGVGFTAFDKPITAKAFRLDTHRLEGDDYVHIAEWQFCKPGKVDALIVQRIKQRRQAITAAKAAVPDPDANVPVNTVVWYQAKAQAGDVTLPVEGNVKWEALTSGVEPFGEEPGFFEVTKVGKQRVRVTYGDLSETMTITGTPRQIRNREPDVEIVYIERLPRIDYPKPGNMDPRAGWPAEGQRITWRAHLYNWGRKPVEVNYVWKLDDRVVGQGKVELPVGPPEPEFTPIDLPWEWEFKRHDLTLTIRPTTPLDELITLNNTLTIQTDAITVGMWCERSLWEYHHEHQHRLPTRDGNSFAGWGQRMIRKWNEMFRLAVFPEFPNGIQERVRLDQLVIVPDFALPLAGGLPSNNPDLRDKSVDMTWGMESGDIKPGVELDPGHWWSPEKAIKAFADGHVDAQKMDPPFWCGLGYIHEMAHARYLVDAYGFNVHTGQGEDLSERTLPLTADGKPVIGTYMPVKNDIQHWRKYVGQMGGDYWHWSKFDAMCWDRRRGWRARGGNCNSPPTIGEFLQDIPKRVIYRYVDEDGNPLANAKVWVYQARGTGTHWYTKKYIDEPDITKTADSQGRVTFDRTMWTPDGKIKHTYGHSSGKVCVRVTYDGQHYFLFEEVTDANLAYNFGHTDEYEFTRVIKLRNGDPSPDEWDVNANWDPPGFYFERK